MADNVTLPGTSRVIRAKDRSGVETQVMALDLNPAGAETLMAGVMPAQITDGTNTVAVITRDQTSVKALAVSIGPTDLISDLPVFMDYDHHQAHEGEMFRYVLRVNAGANTTQHILKLVVPSIVGFPSAPLDTQAKRALAVRLVPHLRFEFISDTAGECEFYEAPTFDAAGSTATPVAQERNGTYTPKLVPYTGATITDDPAPTTALSSGTLIWRGMILASKTSAGGLDGSSTEFPLKNNTAYALRFKPAANSAKFLIRCVWYEDLGV